MKHRCLLELTHDVPWHSRLLGAFVGIVVVSGVLTILAGGFFINRMVIGEAQRRVELGLKTAHAILGQRLNEAQRACQMMAEELADAPSSSLQQTNRKLLNRWRIRSGFDYLHVVSSHGVIVASARGRAVGAEVNDGQVVIQTLRQRKPDAGVCLIPLSLLALEDESLAERARIKVLPTPRAKPGGPTELKAALVYEAAAPIVNDSGQLRGAVRVGTVLNGNFDFVDFVRENIFTAATYGTKNLGTVTIFQGDVRIATNVKGPDGKRAVGTRVSAEVYDRVLGEGNCWTGPAFVVDSWYISAYEPLRDPRRRIIGMLYVGVLKDRYDGMRNQALGLFVFVSVLALIGAALLAELIATRLVHPLTQLTVGAAEVAKGNLQYQLPRSPRAKRDEINRLTLAFNQMVSALKERDEALRRSHNALQRTADELHRSMQNYLGTLEFITHELKNQVAAMKINLLAVRDGYVGRISDDQHAALDDVAAAITRAEEMILNYLNLSRIEKGEMQVRIRPVSVEADVVRPVLRDLRGRLELKQMRVEVELEEDLMAIADPSLLQIVYANLLSNAAKYGREGGVIRLSGWRRDGLVELHVWNDGPGVPAERMNELFQKFSRLFLTGHQARGTGLGLFITREIIRRHGGEIRAESDYGKWIDFVFTLPAPEELRDSISLPTDEMRQRITT